MCLKANLQLFGDRGTATFFIRPTENHVSASTRFNDGRAEVGGAWGSPGLTTQEILEAVFTHTTRKMHNKLGTALSYLFAA